MSQIQLNTILGTASFGELESFPSFKVPTKLDQFLGLLKKYGFYHVDTARFYGTSEAVLGSLDDHIKQDLIIDTKVLSFKEGAHHPNKLRESVKTSLENLKVKKVHILYLHSPDRATPIEDVLRTINDIYKEGSFEKFGLSNYPADEVEQIVKICKENNYVLPTVYQGNYNLVTRKNEETLFPLLKRENISFFAYSPVAGGFFSLTKDSEGNNDSGRFGGNHPASSLYRSLYFKDSYFRALDELTAVATKYELSNAEVAIRWLYNHSQLKAEHGDSIIFGASARGGLEQLESNLISATKGALPNEVVDTVERIWATIKDDAPNYHY